MSIATGTNVPPPPPPPRRVVATQTGPDTAVFSSDGPIPLVGVPYTPYYRASVWVEKFPGDNSDAKKDTGLEALSTIVINNGLSFFYLDLPPSSTGVMHYTNSIDFGVVLSGQVELELPGGNKTLLRTGDTFVQRGNSHAWNVLHDTDWVRLLVVVTDAKKLEYQVDGKAVAINSTNFP